MPLNDYSYHFNRFWKDYPVKVGKGAAWKVWERLVKGEDEGAFADMLVAHLTERNKRDAKWLEGKYVPQPSTFLGQARWEDDYRWAKPAAPSHKNYERPEEPFANAAPPEVVQRHLEELKRTLH